MTPQLEVGLTAIRKIADVWQSARPDSLIDYTKQLRVEPICLIDQDCLYLESLPDVQQSLLSIFAGYYLQAVSVSTQVGSVHVGRELDKLNPNRDALGHAIDRAHTVTGDVLRMENYEDRLPTPMDFEDVPEVALEHYSLSLEKAKTDGDKLAQIYRIGRKKLGRGVKAMNKRDAEDLARRKHPERKSTHGDDTMKNLREQANLSVGKIFEVSITDGKHSVQVPVAIRLMANAIDSASLVHILGHGTQDTSVKERYHAWRSGRLEFIRDLILCNDLVEAKRKNLMKDKDGLYSSMTARQRNGFWSGIITNQPSIGMASNLVVMSQATADQLELQTNYQLKSFAQRQKIFEATALMIMVVVDKEWDRVTFYHRGIPTPTQLGIRDLKAANKGSGPDVSDILRAYQVGHSPSF